jgi:FdhE protein
MPPVALPPSHREARLAAAAERWNALLTAKPDLEPAIALQKDLVRIVVELAEILESRPLPRLSLPPRYLAAKLSRGIPALAGEPIPVPAGVLKRGFLSLCDALARGGAGEVAERIGRAVEEGAIEIGSLLGASLARDHHAIRTGATHRGLSPDLVWLAAELAVSPYAHALQRVLLIADDDALHAAVHAWNHGYCPACGSWPALAEVASSHRVLRCSFCAFAWELPTYSCIYCREDGDSFVTAAPDEECKSRRLEVCGSCGGYLKTVEVAALSPFPLLAISDLETMALDAAAMEHGYTRPTLRDFTTHKPG